MSVKDHIASLTHQLALGDATEHTHRPALKSLIESLAIGITATNISRDALKKHQDIMRNYVRGRQDRWSRCWD